MSEVLGIPASTLQNCRARLEDQFGMQLFNTLPKSSKNTLTPQARELCRNGEDLIARLHELRHRPLDQNTIVRFIVSHSLLIHLFPTAIRGFLEKQRAAHREVVLQPEDHIGLEQTISLVVSGDADFAVLWDIEERESTVTKAGLIYYRFETRLDLVVICSHHHPFAERLLTDPPKPVMLEELAKETVLCLQGLRQPLYDHIPHPKDGGQRLVMDHFSTIIEMLRAGHKGVAVVPGVFRELDYMRKAGELFHIPLAPIQESDKATGSTSEGISIAAVFRGQLSRHAAEGGARLSDYDWPTKTSPAGDLLLELDNYLRTQELLPTSGWAERFDTAGVGKSFHSLHSFRHVWYLSCARIGIDRPRWEHGVIEFGGPPNPNGGGPHLSGTLVAEKCPPEEYDVSAALVGKALIHLHVDARYRQETFTATMNMSHLRGGVRFLVGTWSGQDSRGSPLTGPFLLTDGEVDLRTIIRINRHAMLRVLVNVNLSADMKEP